MTSLPRRTAKRLTKELSDLNKEGGQHECVKVMCGPDDDLLNWYFMIHDLEDEPYVGGYYIGHIKLSDKYPMKAPVIEMLTPSGRFEPYKKICTTFTHYHEESWSPSWTLKNCCIGLISFMLDDNDKGVGSIKATNSQRKEMAEESLEYNRVSLSKYMNLFEKFLVPKEESVDDELDNLE